MCKIKDSEFDLTSHIVNAPKISMHSCLNSDQDIENVYKYFFNHGNHMAVSTLDLVHEHFPQKLRGTPPKITET